MNARFDPSEGADAGFEGQCPECGQDTNELDQLREKLKNAEQELEALRPAYKQEALLRLENVAEGNKLRAQLQDARIEVADHKQRVKSLTEASLVFRECVLNERHQLNEIGLDSDQVNAVLGLFDDIVAPAIDSARGNKWFVAGPHAGELAMHSSEASARKHAAERNPPLPIYGPAQRVE